MAGGSIKLFQFTKKLCQTFGIIPPQPNENRYHINSTNWFTLFCLNQFFISTTGFLWFEANSMAEYSKSFFVCSAIVNVNIWCLTAFWQAENISMFVGNCEEFIEKRQSHNGRTNRTFSHIFVIFTHFIKTFSAI